MTLAADTTGAEPEKVLVLDVVDDPGDFISTAKDLGFEWLFDEESEIEQDDDFVDEKKPDDTIQGRMYALFANNQAMVDFRSLFNRWKNDPQKGLGDKPKKWGDLFKRLSDVRLWGWKDRVAESGVLEYWKRLRDAGDEHIHTEIEIWYREAPKARTEAENRLRRLVKRCGGEVPTAWQHEGIRYHAIIVSLPTEGLDNIGSAQGSLKELRDSDQIFHFRPAGQCSTPSGEPDDELPKIPPKEYTDPEEPPIVALLDGLPLENHVLLQDRLIVDDPDEFASYYQVGEKQHGTSMASLILHGELDANESTLNSPLYTRPIMIPYGAYEGKPRNEAIPETQLFADILHRAVRRMFEGNGSDIEPVAPTVRIINLSIGDPNQPFRRSMSAVGRMADWLSWKYSVLFVISAGNYTKIDPGIQHQSFEMPSNDWQEEFLRQMDRDLCERGVLAPAESLNALTVGAEHADNSPANGSFPSRCVDPIRTKSMPSPLNPLGFGFRRSIKPELLTPGGRQIFELDRYQTAFTAARYNNLPGQSVAWDGGITKPGSTSETKRTRGTSNAAALTSRLGAILHNDLRNLTDETGVALLQNGNEAVLLKTLLVHSASWGQTARDELDKAINLNGRSSVKQHISRFLGYGTVDRNRLQGSTEQRVTMLRDGEIGKEETHRFHIPLPDSLNGKREWRRLTVTLAWLTPINPARRKYRGAKLEFDTGVVNDSDDDIITQNIFGDTAGMPYKNNVKNGTVQHEVYEREASSAWSDNAEIYIDVTCRQDAEKSLSKGETVPYALAVTIEVGEGVGINLYEEIRNSLGVQVPVVSVQD